MGVGFDIAESGATTVIAATGLGAHGAGIGAGMNYGGNLKRVSVASGGRSNIVSADGKDVGPGIA